MKRWIAAATVIAFGVVTWLVLTGAWCPWNCPFCPGK